MKKEFKLKSDITILLILLLTTTGFSQTNWTVKSSANSGLVNNVVRKLYQDSNGKIWVGTAKGLNIINDNNWDTYTRSNGLPHNIVWDIGEDNNGNIWVATQKGIALFNGKDWTYINRDDGIAHNKVFALETDSKGNVWLGTRKGVSMYDGENWRNYGTVDGLCHKVVIDIMEDESGHMWFATKKGISVYDGENWIGFNTKDGLARNFVWSLAEDSKGTIWIGTHTGAFNKLNGENWETIKKGSGYYDATILVGGILNGIIWGLVIGPGGFIFTAIGAVGGALPSPNHITSVYIDAKDNAWLAAQPKGIFMFDGKDWSQFNKNNGLPHNRVYDMLQMDDGSMWFGTKKGIAIMER